MPRNDSSTSRLSPLLRTLLDLATQYGSMVLIVLLLFGLILAISGNDPIQSYKDILTSTLGSPYGFSEVIVTMTPMLITALAVALPSRIGLINVGDRAPGCQTGSHVELTLATNIDQPNPGWQSHCQGCDQHRNHSDNHF